MPHMMYDGACIIALIVVLMAWSLTGCSIFGDHGAFHRNAMRNVETYLTNELVGQDVAVQQLVAAIGQHLRDPEPQRALVLSVHGPPGVGKTFTHLLLARALFNSDPNKALKCPGEHCLGYKVIMGLGFSAATHEQQLLATMQELDRHINQHSNSLIVLEEYDKMDCRSRRLFRFLVDNPSVKYRRSIILLESNLGFTDIVQLREKVGSDQLTAESAERVLKRAVTRVWAAQDCEGLVDTVRYQSLISYFLPYMPLTWDNIRELLKRDLQKRWQARKAAATAACRAGSRASRELCGRLGLRPTPEAVEWLVDKVDGSGKDSGIQERYPVEGASQVPRKVTLYAQRALDKLPLEESDFCGERFFTLDVAPDGRGLEVVSTTGVRCNKRW